MTAVGYGVWLVVSAAGVAESTRSEELVRPGALLVMFAGFTAIPRAWSRAMGIASFFALILTVTVVLQSEALRP